MGREAGFDKTTERSFLMQIAATAMIEHFPAFSLLPDQHAPEKPSMIVAANVKSANAGRFVTVTPEQPEARAASATVRIPPRSAIVLLEQ
jgi:hypothetical protein